MKKILSVFLFAVMAFSLTACSSTSQNTQSTGESSSAANTSSAASSSDSSKETDSGNGSKILVAYFSRAGENYGVGVIEKGNTRIIAEMIADEKKADTFEIARVTPYPQGYDDCTDVAKKEQNDNARPELTAKVDNFDDYDVIFLGYPNWWGDMPMPVYTFLESYDFSGKTVIPFCTHGGSGLSNTVNSIKSECKNATVLDGLAIPGTTAQNKQDEAKNTVVQWLSDLKI